MAYFTTSYEIPDKKEKMTEYIPYAVCAGNRTMLSDSADENVP